VAELAAKWHRKVNFQECEQDHTIGTALVEYVEQTNVDDATTRQSDNTLTDRGANSRGFGSGAYGRKGGRRRLLGPLVSIMALVLPAIILRWKRRTIL
jgi:hypothetical protein